MIPSNFFEGGFYCEKEQFIKGYGSASCDGACFVRVRQQ